MSRPHYISDEYVDGLIRKALREDVGAGDVTSIATVPVHATARGSFFCKEAGVAAGLAVAADVFRHAAEGVRVEWKVPDGSAVKKGQELGRVSGSARAILAAERLALNLMQRMSGIATMTHRMVEATRPYGSRILDTRKTAPGLRLLDKWAVRLGGGGNHRIGLFDMILIKENHIACAGGLRQAVEAARSFADAHSNPLRIELEVTTLEDVHLALEVGGVDVLLLDNMTSVIDDGSLDTTLLAQAVELIGGTVETEASGNVTIETVTQIARTGVDNISCGALTHSAAALDISLILDFLD